MYIVFLYFGIISVLLLIAAQISSHITCGNLIKDDEWIGRIQRQKAIGCRKKGDSIFLGKDSIIIYKPCVIDILSKYYIDGAGRVPRGSKCEKLLNELFKTTKSKNK